MEIKDTHRKLVRKFFPSFPEEKFWYMYSHAVQRLLEMACPIPEDCPAEIKKQFEGKDLKARLNFNVPQPQKEEPKKVIEEQKPKKERKPKK